MNFGQFRTAVANELGINANAAGNGTEQQTVDDAINVAVQRVLEDTECYVKRTDFTGFDGSSVDYTMDSGILEIIELVLTSVGTQYSLERISPQAIIEKRRVGAPTGSPTQYYSLAGANLLMFYPGPGSSDTLTVYNVPIPTALSASSDDPSSTTLGGIPSILHRAIFYWACKECASYDDDQTSAQGQRYSDNYDKEITRYREILRKRGGSRNARARVNEKRRRGPYHDNSVYPRV